MIRNALHRLVAYVSCSLGTRSYEIDVTPLYDEKFPMEFTPDSCIGKHEAWEFCDDCRQWEPILGAGNFEDERNFGENPYS